MRSTSTDPAVRTVDRMSYDELALILPRPRHNSPVMATSLVILPTLDCRGDGTYPIVLAVAALWMEPVCAVSLSADSIRLVTSTEAGPRKMHLDILPASCLPHVHWEPPARIGPDVSTLHIEFAHGAGR